MSVGGQPLTASITRTTGADESTYPPTPGTPKTYTFSAGLAGYTDRDRAGTNILASDVKVLVTRPLVASDDSETTPLNGDKMTVSGVEYSVVSVRAVMFGGYPVLWVCQCRGSG